MCEISDMTESAMNKVYLYNYPPSIPKRMMGFELFISK